MIPSTNTTRRVLLVCAVIGILPTVAHSQNLSELKLQVEELLRRHHVPGASIAIIVDEQIAWTEGVGFIEVNTDRRVKVDTLFQAASISKPIAAFGALLLVQDEQLALDASIAKSLKTVRLDWANAVTLRQLLSHTSGLSVSGFDGYRAGSRIPTLSQVLCGRAPSNSARIILQSRPGTRYQYSGGGYCAVQQLIVDATGKSFPASMDAIVLSQVGMSTSTYEQPLPRRHWGRAATAHDSRSNPIRGKWHVYPEMAAAGLWTTASDLARFILAVQYAYEGHEKARLKQTLAHEMLKSQIPGGPGLGLFVYGDDRSGGFNHTGSNNGFRCKISATKGIGDGLVIMTNSENGDRIYAPIERLVREALSSKN